MSKYIAIGFILLLSCTEQPENGPVVKGAEALDAVSVIEVDGCEYVWAKGGYGGGLAHKGNCKNHQLTTP